MCTARKRKATVSGLIESLRQSETVRPNGGIVAGMAGTASLRSPSPGTDPLYDVLQAKYVR